MNKCRCIYIYTFIKRKNKYIYIYINAIVKHTNSDFRVCLTKGTIDWKNDLSFLRDPDSERSCWHTSLYIYIYIYI